MEIHFFSLNVAVTRAKRQVLIIGNSGTFIDIADREGYEILNSLYTHACEFGRVISSTEITSVSTFQKVEDFQQPQIEAFGEQLIIDESKLSGKITVNTKSRQNEDLKEKSQTVQTESYGERLKKINKSKNIFNATQQPNAKSASSRQWTREELEKKISKIIELNTSIEFPSTLTGSERKLVHEICEQFPNLNHESRGIGKYRCIFVSVKNQGPIELEEHSGEQIIDQIPDENIKSSEPEIRFKPPTILKIPTSPKHVKPVQVLNKNTVVTKNPGTNVEAVSDTRAEPREGIRPSTTSNNKCSFKDCSVKVDATAVLMLTSRCPFCLCTFCSSHNLAESHGCGRAAQEHARKQVDAKRNALNSKNREELKQKLKKKLNDSKQGRSVTSKKWKFGAFILLEKLSFKM